VQNKQQNYKYGLMVVLLVLSGVPAGAREGAIARPAPEEPLLHDGGLGRCDPGLGGADVVSGVDVSGHPVAPAGPQARVPVPDQILVPLKSGGRGARSGEAPMVALDGKALDRLLNPPPACPPGKR
jgi:hypothetical protein